jgi:Tfp pilus assembly protein PilV
MSLYLLPIFNFTNLYKKSQQFLRGFFLLEVCCALGLFICLMSGLVHLIVHCTTVVSESKQRMDAFLIARSYAERLCMQRKEGKFDFLDNGYAIHGDVVRDRVYPYFFDVTVTAQGRGRTRTIHTGYCHDEG